MLGHRHNSGQQANPAEAIVPRRERSDLAGVIHGRRKPVLTFAVGGTQHALVEFYPKAFPHPQQPVNEQSARAAFADARPEAGYETFRVADSPPPSQEVAAYAINRTANPDVAPISSELSSAGPESIPVSPVTVGTESGAAPVIDEAAVRRIINEEALSSRQ
jgi:hypothetical protein